MGIDLLSQVTGQEETALNCVRGDLDWIPAKMSPLRSLSSTGAGCQEKWCNHHPWGDIKDM